MATVVFLLSDKRSGSTFLENELVAHPQIQNVDYTSHTYNETHYWLKAAQLLGMPESLFSGHRYSRSYGGGEQIRKSLVAGIQGNVAHFEPSDDDKEMVFQGWEALCEKFADPVFIEKSPQHAHHWAALELILQWAEQTHHKAKIIALVRNPMSVMYSAFKLFHTPPEQRQYGWFEAYNNLLLMERLRGDCDFHWVRYENIVTEPEHVFEELCRFIGVDTDPGLGQSAHTNSNNIWHDDPAFTLQLDSVVKRLAKHFGYSDEDLVNPGKQEQNVSQKTLVRARRLYHRIYSRLYNLYKRNTLK